MDPFIERLTERLTRAGLHVAVIGCSVVALLLVGTALQQVVFPDRAPLAIQVPACLVGLALSLVWTRTVGRRWSAIGTGPKNSTPIVHLEDRMKPAARGAIARRR